MRYVFACTSRFCASFHTTLPLCTALRLRDLVHANAASLRYHVHGSHNIFACTFWVYAVSFYLLPGYVSLVFSFRLVLFSLSRLLPGLRVHNITLRDTRTHLHSLPAVHVYNLRTPFRYVFCRFCFTHSLITVTAQTRLLHLDYLRFGCFCTPIRILLPA